MLTQTRHDPLSVQPAAVQAPASRSAGGLKRVSLGGIAKKKDDKGSKYPTYPDEDGRAGEIAARIAERQEVFEAVRSALETDKAELGRVIIRPWYLQHFHRKSDVASSVLVPYTIPANPEAGTEEVRGAVRVTVKEKFYSFPSEDPIAAILGDEVSKYFRQSFELKVDGDKLPSDKAPELIEKMQELFAQYGCSDALEAKECILPVENFKALRFSEMSLEQSLALESLGDKGLTETMVSTKNVR
jgi:hypothetical protein